MLSASFSTQAPCINCRARHQKCDKRKPVCRRCEKRGLNCRPVEKKAVFLQGSSDTCFSGGQVWVNSKPKNWRPIKETPTSTEISPIGAPKGSNIPIAGNRAATDTPSPFDTEIHQIEREEVHPFHNLHQIHGEPPQISRAVTLEDHVTPPTSIRGIRFTNETSLSIGYQHKESPENYHISHPNYQALTPEIPCMTRDVVSQSLCNTHIPEASEAIQQACLLRYFIDELSPWFDHCDEHRHFKLVVPCRAKHCTTLQNAIFAVSARHLSRLSQYQTSHGIVYHGQILPNLRKSSALEYMLKCIPDLIEFPHIQDRWHQENIMAATVILRQYEEMEEEPDESDAQSAQSGAVNFLAITQTIIDSMSGSQLDCSLATATYWITVRQEIYFSLKRQAVPHLRFDADLWRNASIANITIMFAGQVAKWRWGQQSFEEWVQLKTQEQHLHRDFSGELEPILDIKAAQTKGQIFPTVWYNFDFQVTAVQHLRLAQMILIAENPHLERANRASHRKAEAQTRDLVLNICGIALCHRQVQPALVNAVLAITLYGEYFTNPDERAALIEIIDITNNIRAWPMRKQYETVRRQWEILDNEEI